MPTGYTAAVESGEMTEFPDFAMRCSRAMGACIMLREEPMDVLPTPENVIDKTTYDEDALVKARARLAALEAMTPGEIEEQAGAWNVAQAAGRNTANDRYATERKRYEDMLSKVLAWTPPTPDHEGFKQFMVEQLEVSMRHIYPDKPHKPIPPGEWHERQVASAKRDIDYHIEQAQKQRERNDARARWVRDLIASLEPSDADRP